MTSLMPLNEQIFSFDQEVATLTIHPGKRKHVGTYSLKIRGTSLEDPSIVFSTLLDLTIEDFCLQAQLSIIIPAQTPGASER